MSDQSESKVVGDSNVGKNDDPGPPTPFSGEKGELSSRIHGFAIIFVGACLLGTIPLFSRQLQLEGVTSLFISTARMFLAFLFAAGGLLVTRTSPLALDKGKCVGLFIFGTVCSGATSVCYIFSLQYTTVANAIFTVSITVPITTYVVSRVYRVFRKMHLACFGLALIGFAALLWGKFYSSGGWSAHRVGLFFGVMTGICFGTYAPFAEKLSDLKASVILFWGFGIGFLCHLPMIWWTRTRGLPGRD